MILHAPTITLFPYTTLFRSFSKDGGKSWNWAEVNDFDTIVWPTEVVSLPVMICVQEKQNECYRINKERIVEISREIGRATSELQSPCNLVCRLLLEKKKTKT